jgi:prepilin-type N-terminal cleavage/methylation domain-containing protein
MNVANKARERMRRSQSGLTLIELSIVLVIVGLLLGSVFAAHEMVHGARVKSLAGDFIAVPTYVYAYQDTYRALPGDDRGARSRLPGATLAAASPSLGNGRIDAAWNSMDAGDESRVFWQHLRLAGLASGPVALEDPNFTPRNSLGGAIGFSSVSPAQLQVAGMRGDYQMCSAGIPSRFVLAVDLTLDDGEPATGMVRAVADGAAPGALPVVSAALDDVRTYTLCMTF